MAAGLNGSYGKETQDSPERNVDIERLILGRAQSLNKQGKKAKDLKSIPDAEWNASYGGISKEIVGAHMRAYENYSV